MSSTSTSTPAPARIVFVSWDLWQQMTFVRPRPPLRRSALQANNVQVLACAIVLVFFAGLAKLWWTNRSVRRHELLDEEKNARVSEIEKTGLSMRKKPEVPFGVRAIQSGIQVDGIWISRPGTPNSHTPLKVPSSLTLTGSDQDSKRKLKLSGKLSETSSDSSSSSTVGGNSPPRSPAIRAQSTYKPKHAPGARTSLRATESYNAESLSALEGAGAGAGMQTYIPTSPFSPSPVVKSDSASSSSEEGVFVPSHHSSVRTHQSRVSLFPDVSVERKRSYTRGPLEGTTVNPEGRKPSLASSLRMPTTAATRPSSRDSNARRDSDADSERGQLSRSSTMYSRPLRK